MIRAIFLVFSLMVITAAVIVLVNFYNKREELKRQLHGREYDPKTGVYFDPRTMERTEKNGVISFRSKDQK